MDEQAPTTPPLNDPNQTAPTNTDPTPPPVTEPTATPTKGYGKKPLWFWVVVYLGVGAVVYFLVYYFFFRGGSSLY